MSAHGAISVHHFYCRNLQPSYFKSRFVYKPMYGWIENHFCLSFIFDSMLRKGGGGWFLSSKKKDKTWFYAMSWCAMFVLYTGSGEMLLLTMDSEIYWLSVVLFLPFEPCCAVMTSWWRWWCHTITTWMLMRSHWLQLWMLLDVVTQKKLLVNLNNKDKQQFMVLMPFFFFVYFFTIKFCRQTFVMYSMIHMINYCS